MRFTDTPQGATFRAESAPGGVDYDLVAGHRKLTGAAPMFPKSAFGLFMSKERYQAQQELIDAVRRFPSDWIVQDWQYGGRADDGGWSSMGCDAARYPDPAAPTRTLHWISRQARIHDAFSDEGRGIYFRRVERGLLDAGGDALWMGDFARYLNVYSLRTMRGV